MDFVEYSIELITLQATKIMYVQLPRVGNNSMAKAGTCEVCDRAVCYTIQATMERKIKVRMKRSWNNTDGEEECN